MNADMKLVLIEWIDAAGCGSGWEIFEDKPTPEPVKIKSVGWLFYDGEDCKEIIPHWGEKTKCSSEQGCGSMTIPVVNIVSICELKYDPKDMFYGPHASKGKS